MWLIFTAHILVTQPPSARSINTWHQTYMLIQVTKEEGDMTSECSAVSCVVMKCMHPAESWTRTRTARVCQHGHHHLRLHPLTRWSWRRALWLNPTYGDPPHEFMQSSHSCNRLMTWPQTHMAAHDFIHMQRLSTWTHSQGQATITHISHNRNKASSSAQVNTVVCVKNDCAESNSNMTCVCFLIFWVFYTVKSLLIPITNTTTCGRWKKGKRRYDYTSPPKPRIAKQVVRKICTADRTLQSSQQELNRNKDSKEYELPSLLSTNSSNSKSKKVQMRLRSVSFRTCASTTTV